MKKYITADDYKIAKGIDLNIEIQDDDNKSNKVNRFIQDITDWCVNYLVINYDNNDLNENIASFDDLAEWRQNRFRKGVINQIEYVLSVGLIDLQSGINQDLGTITDYSKVVLGNSAYREFKLGGFCNIVSY